MGIICINTDNPELFPGAQVSLVNRVLSREQWQRERKAQGKASGVTAHRHLAKNGPSLLASTFHQIKVLTPPLKKLSVKQTLSEEKAGFDCF